VLAGVPLSRLYPQHPQLANYLLVAVTELTDAAQQGVLLEKVRSL
jgi:hypothetical protein